MSNLNNRDSNTSTPKTLVKKIGKLIRRGHISDNNNLVLKYQSINFNMLYAFENLIGSNMDDRFNLLSQNNIMGSK